MIYPLNNDLLLIKTLKFDFNGNIDPNILTENMIESVTKYKGLGLSCNQVGVPYSMFVMKIDNGKFAPFFNPKIVNFSEETELGDEGCLSYPGILIKVKRSKSVRLRYQDVSGQTLTKVFNNLPARVVQHECDHLNGVLFTFHSGRVKLERALKEAKKKGFNYNMKDLIDGNNQI